MVLSAQERERIERGRTDPLPARPGRAVPAGTRHREPRRGERGACDAPLTMANSADFDSRAHPGMDEALEAVDTQGQGTSSQRPPSRNHRCPEGAAQGSPRTPARGTSPSRPFRKSMQPPPKLATSVNV